MLRFSLLVLCLSTAPLLADDLPPPSPEQIAQLIKLLDADDFAARERATEALIKLGEPTEEALKKVAAESKSVELKERVDRVLASIHRERLQRDALKLDTLYQLARAICEKKAKPEDLDPMIDKILAEIATAAKYEFKPPIRIANCTLRPAPTTEVNSLIVGSEDTPTSYLRNSAGIFDIGGHCSTVTNSIVIAWGVVDISSCSNSIIIAGADVSINSSCRNSIVLAGGRVDVNTCTKSVIGCGEVFQPTFPLRENTIVVNTKFEPKGAAAAGGLEQVTSVDVPGLVLRDKPVMERILDDKLQLTYLSTAFMLFKVPNQPGEYVVRTGNELLDPLGQPVQGLEGWKVARLSTRFSILKKGDERTFLRMPRPGE